MSRRSGLILSVIVAAGVAGCQPKSSSAPQLHTSPAKTDRPVSESQLNTIELTEDAVRRLGLVTAIVEQREMRRARAYGAEIVLPTGSSVILSAPVTGTLQIPQGDGFPRPGSKVAADQVLFEIVPLLSPERAVLTPSERIRFAEAKNLVQQSRIDAAGQVKQAQVQVEAAQIALTRAQRLLKEQAGTGRAVDDAQAQLSLAEKGLEAVLERKKLVDSIDLEGAEAGVVKPLPIGAPLAGQVRMIQVRPGETVAAGAPLFEIINTESLWLRVPVYAGELDEISQQEPAMLMELDGRHPAESVSAQPLELPPTSAPLAAAVDIYFEIRNPDDKFRPGQRMTARLNLKGHGERSVLPWSAVIHDIYGGQWVYEQISERKFVRRRVEVEWVQGDQAVLRRGPVVGTKLVTAGAAELSGTEFGFAK